MPWVLRGLRDGVLTTRYPSRPDEYADQFPAAVETTGAPSPATRRLLRDVRMVEDLCPTRAIQLGTGGEPRLDRGRCILCGECVRARPDLFRWATGSDTARLTRGALVVPDAKDDAAEISRVRDALHRRVRAFRRSVHIRHVDAGSDGSDEWEVLALLNPVYDVHRLGVFFTASPRHADILLVTGAGARGMSRPLIRTLTAMPQPVVVIAAGADAASGGLLAGSYAVRDGVSDLLPVDVFIPGSPASPFSLLHGILLALNLLPRQASRRVSPEALL